MSEHNPAPPTSEECPPAVCMDSPTSEGRDVTCEHGTAMDVHCCNCHSGFIFDSKACVCLKSCRCGVLHTQWNLPCDREVGHSGQHRCCIEQHDAVEFWPQSRPELSGFSAGPWTACRMVHDERGDDLTPEELGEYVKNSVIKSAQASRSTAFLFVSCEKADGPADVCHVGNGPTSPANARLIAAAPNLLRENAELRATLAQKDEEIAQLSAERDDFHMNYRMKCDVETKALAEEVARLKDWRVDVARALRFPGGSHYDDVPTKIKEMRLVLADLAAVVRGECPALLNEDSGGDAFLALRIERILGRPEPDGAQ